MSWWGKVIGGAFGFVLGGPLGALFGAALGHNFDIRRSGAYQPSPIEFDPRERAQTAFFTASFAVMGYLAKADGRVTREEVQAATAIMGQMGLDPELRQVAQRLFREGRQPHFDLQEVLNQLRRECRGRRNLLRLFIEIQLAAAFADGELHPREYKVLVQICETLGFSRYELDILVAMTRAQHRFRRGTGRPARDTEMSLKDAYAMLNVSPAAEPPDIKRAYRRLMSQHHPDKLVAKGLPEEMVRVATQKTQEIKAAYEKVREARGF